MQDELWKPGVNTLGDPTNGISEKVNMLDCLNLTSYVQQNPVMISAENEKSPVRARQVEFRALVAQSSWCQDRIERRISSLLLSTDRLNSQLTDRLVIFCHLGLNIHLSRNRASERKSKCKEANDHVDSGG